MKKRIYGTLIFSSLLVITIVKVNINENTITGFTLENIEAFAQMEQPDTKDCVDSDEWDCIALHPTDPAKDKIVEDAMWPTN